MSALLITATVAQYFVAVVLVQTVLLHDSQNFLDDLRINLLPSVECKCKDNLTTESKMENMAQVLRKRTYFSLGSYGCFLFLITCTFVL